MQGKRIRCKECGHIFAVRTKESNPSSAKEGGRRKQGDGKPAKRAEREKPGDLKKIEAKSFAQEMLEEEFKDDSNPYDVTSTDLRPRCPHCAMAMDEGQIICLNCGYNTQTRMHGVTVRVMGATIWERLVWLSPGIACVLAVGGLIALIFFLWLGLRGMEAKDPSSWLWYFFDNFPTQVYGTVFALVAIWFAGKFAVKRLILNPNPPERVKR